MNTEKLTSQKTFKSALFLSTALIGAVLTGPALAGQPVETRVQKLEATIIELQRELDAVKADQAATATKPAAESPVMFKGGPAFEAADGSWAFKVRGRIEADAAFYDKSGGNNPVDLNNGTELRRARIGVDGKIYNDWLYRLEADFGKASRNDNASNEVDVKDAYIAFTGIENTRITVGQHKTPNSLEQLTSSTDLVFTERPLAVEAFNHRLTAGGDFKAGVSAGYTGENYTLTTGIFGSNFAASSNPAGVANDEGWGVHGRATWAPVQEKGKVLHLGASGYWRDAGGQNGFGGTAVRFRSGPEVSAVDGTRFVDTGNLAADTYTSYGAELGGVWGPFHAQAEYLTASVDQTAGLPSLDFDGGYVQLGYVITGESRNYKNGLFSRVKPANPFSLKTGGAGAWEVAARASTVDLNDGALLGGSQDNYAGAVNWYINEYLRVGVNYVSFDAERAGITTKGSAVVTRIGVNW
ncbi:MAG: OprO/OprP family phosphate-selective porin [Alphaproteobacteria bacterium]|nr:OprO/OprP family phosphate-selective porin [Alphaproteobacteria bacterium]MDX5416625.1 OprO/OprP family phosphate-selective porin [Alphaproteobacteria bacterium]MDX5493989.1 OprO/OprP family phosphate-selective porin [Alphaproteobacteria bacterium]